MSAKKILMVVTSHARLGETGQKTGLWLEELAAPYYEFKRAGAQIDLASPLGGLPPIDPKSDDKPGAPPGPARTFLGDREAMDQLERTKKLRDVAGGYDAYFVVGGHGVMWDLPGDADLRRLLARGFDDGKVVAAVCHGPAALVDVRLANGAWLVSGRGVTGFSNEEEIAVKLDQVVPFLLEDKLSAAGGRYKRGPVWQPFALADGRLITGQNPASSVAVAQAVLAALGGKTAPG